MDWDYLIENITAGKIIPVLGSDLSLVKDDNGSRVPLYRYIAKKLAEEMGIPYEGQELGELTLALRDQYTEIIPEINTIYRNIDESRFISGHLERLVDIRNFDFFVSTSLDDLLVRALCKKRNIKPDLVEVINYSPREVSVTPPNNDSHEKVTVFNILGNFFNIISPAIHEEEKLEHVFSIAMTSTPHSLPEYFLQRIDKKILLFIGCDFPDWFMRFIIRIISNERYKKRSLCDYIVWDGGEGREKITRFLREFKKNIYPPGEDRTGNLWAFLDELHDRLGIYVVPQKYEGPVFLSCHHDDAKQASRLKQFLGVNGFEVTIAGNNPGRGVEDIKDHIRRCSVFIPLISNRLLADPGCDAQSVQWKNIRKRISADRYYRQNITFKMLPVIIDDTTPGDERLPEYFSKNEIKSFPHQRDAIVNTIRDY
ncbi:MAG: hypothetical protein GY757_56655, partial [bacterium]|nr:hypothetical protein [bacterium]